MGATISAFVRLFSLLKPSENTSIDVSETARLPFANPPANYLTIPVDTSEDTPCGIHYEKITECGIYDSIFCETTQRFVVFPIEYPALWAFYKIGLDSFWTSAQIDLTQDKAGWESLTYHERTILGTILSYQANADRLISELVTREFICNAKAIEARCFFGFQAAMKINHSEIRSTLIEQYENDCNARIDNRGVEKLNWVKQWISLTDASIYSRMLIMTVLQSILNAGSIAVIKNLQQRGTMPALTKSSELIMSDDGLSCDFICHILKGTSVKISKQTVLTIVQEAVSLEKAFVSTFNGIEGRTLVCPTAYIEWIANRLLVQLECKAIYTGIVNPTWTTWFGGTIFLAHKEVLQTFHESCDTEDYDNVFRLDAEF